MTSDDAVAATAASSGETLEEIYDLALQRGLLKPGVRSEALTTWIQQEFEIPHEQAVALTARVRAIAAVPDDAARARLFGGQRSRWLATYEVLNKKVQRFGDDIDVEFARTSIRYFRRGRFFAIVKFNSRHFEVGLVRKDADATERFGDAGAWNRSMTHRVAIVGHREIDEQLTDWLRRAYEGD